MDAVDRVTGIERLGWGAKTFRVFHTMIAVVQIAALWHLWSCGLRRRRGKLLRVSMLALAIEGVALVLGRGKCPLGPLQRQLGDPVPLFELVLPRRAAQCAVPLLAAITIVGMGLVVARPPESPSTGA